MYWRGSKKCVKYRRSCVYVCVCAKTGLRCWWLVAGSVSELWASPGRASLGPALRWTPSSKVWLTNFPLPSLPPSSEKWILYINMFVMDLPGVYCQWSVVVGCIINLWIGWGGVPWNSYNNNYRSLSVHENQIPGGEEKVLGRKGNGVFIGRSVGGHLNL